jgi:hypothetical protein
MLEGTGWHRKAVVCVLALGLALISVTIPIWSSVGEETELLGVGHLNEQNIHQREQILAQQLYSAEEQEAQVGNF